VRDARYDILAINLVVKRDVTALWYQVVKVRSLNCERSWREMREGERGLYMQKIRIGGRLYSE